MAGRRGLSPAPRFDSGARLGDLLVRAATVWTLDPARPRAEAVGIRDGVIVAVGGAGDVRGALCRPRELDLGPATVVPGLVDAHGHLLLLGQRLGAVDLSGCRSAEEIASRVAVRASLSPKGAWIRGGGWDQNLFTDGAFPDRAWLDRNVPDHPVFLERVDAHAALLNAAALALTGLDGSPDPEGGRTLRDPRGRPTGVVLDAAMEAAARHLPRPSQTELEWQLLAAMRACAAVGLVGVHEAGLDRDTFAALARLGSRGELPIRVYAMARFGEPRFEQTLAHGPVVGERLSMRAVKFFLDGALGSRGAALFDDYSDAPGERGLYNGPADLEGALCAVLSAGFQPACHAIGDRANALALDALERAQRRSGRTDLRPRIEHAQVLRPEDLARFSRAGIVASMQPAHAVSDAGWAQRRLGPARLSCAYAFKALRAAGARLAFGSDFPIEAPDPLRGLLAARSGLSPSDALEGFTAGAAWAAFEERLAGRIAPGRRADLTAFDRDVLAQPARGLLETRPLLTMVGGECAWQASG